MHAHLLIRPVILGPHGQVVDILQLAKDRLRTALPTIGENNILGGPRVLIRDEGPLAEHFRFQVSAVWSIHQVKRSAPVCCGS
jgi:hypothetical protein